MPAVTAINTSRKSWQCMQGLMQTAQQRRATRTLSGYRLTLCATSMPEQLYAARYKTSAASPIQITLRSNLWAQVTRRPSGPLEGLAGSSTTKHSSKHQRLQVNKIKTLDAIQCFFSPRNHNIHSSDVTAKSFSSCKTLHVFTSGCCSIIQAVSEL